MVQFSHVIRDALGIHARPAGLLVKAAGKYKNATITLDKGGDDKADMKKLFRVMRLGVKQGDTVTVTVEGEDEDAALAELRAIMEETL
ncbi:MAG: HPr family phosphocarrier protein [Planctomycetaceae bacterium]|nr:HPr family phosphocarrier protein [Planctomycetaceae bacterium]